MVGTDFSISTCGWKFFRTCRYCNHIIREFKIWKSWCDFLNLCLLLDFDHVNTIKEVLKRSIAFLPSKTIFNFWCQIWKFNDFLPKFWKFSDTGRNQNIRPDQAVDFLFSSLWQKTVRWNLQKWRHYVILKKTVI